MKTIRRNTFETNSSSVHCVTILSDKEFNLVKEGKAVIDYDHVKEITPDLISNYINDKIDSTENSIERSRKNIEHYNKLQDLDTGDWPEDDKRWIAGWDWKRLSGSELKIALRNAITQGEKIIEDYTNNLTYLRGIDINKMTDLILQLTPSLDKFKNHYYDDEEEEDDETPSYEEYQCSESDFKFATEFLSDKDNIDTFGEGYEESHLDDREIDGILVHVLSYSGQG